MRATVTLDDELLDRAVAVTGIRERGALLREALRHLIAAAADRIALLGGSDPQAAAAPRNRAE